MSTASFDRNIVITDKEAIKVIEKGFKSKPKKLPKSNIQQELNRGIELLKRKFSV